MKNEVLATGFFFEVQTIPLFYIPRTAAPSDCPWSVSSDPHINSRYFDLLEQTIEDNSMKGKSCNNFNMAEMGMPPRPKRWYPVKGCISAAVIVYHLWLYGGG